MTVKGLVERKDKSDLAIWPLSYKEAGDDLSSVYAKTDSGIKVGSIRQANQGVFSILAADQGSVASESGEPGGENFNADSSLMKTVRIVTTVQYYLDK